MTGSPKPLRSLNKDIDHRPSEHLLSLLLRLWPFSACVALCMCHMGCMLCTLHGACITQYACCLVCVKHVVYTAWCTCHTVRMLFGVRQACCAASEELMLRGVHVACVCCTITTQCMMQGVHVISCAHFNGHIALCACCMRFKLQDLCLFCAWCACGTVCMLHCVNVARCTSCKVGAGLVHDVHVVSCARCIVWMLHDVQVACCVLVLCVMCMWYTNYTNTKYVTRNMRANCPWIHSFQGVWRNLTSKQQ